MYVVAIKDTGAWKGDTPFELSMIGFWNLIIVWLKVSSSIAFTLFNKKKLMKAAVADTMAVLPSLGSRRWIGSTRKHGPLYGKQLFHSWILAVLASIV